MSSLNLNWIKENFDEDFVFFDVGCMDMRDSAQLKMMMPKAKVYAFECSNALLSVNLNRAIDFGIHYFHTAVCHIDGIIQFRQSLTQYGHQHLDSGSIFGLNPLDEQGKVYAQPYDVRSIRLETFCEKLNLVPDFIHIDVEGAELKVFQNIGNYKPKCVWAEVDTFEHYATGTTRSEFDNLMYSLGYVKIFDSKKDSLYKLTDFEVTPYPN
jgi:FkbM family methyltransferase